MAKKIISKKITKKISSSKVDEQDSSAEPQQSAQIPQLKKKCPFCKSNTRPTYTDIQALRKFISDRGKILPKLKTGSCSKHQRILTLQIKYSRHLALLPFTPKV